MTYLYALAEREGFEPPIGLPLYRISSAAHSTTLPPLHTGGLPVAAGEAAMTHIINKIKMGKIETSNQS
jgi:hypothetical protein